MAISFVVTHYRLPAKRLEEFLQWNDKTFRATSAKLLIVTDRPFLRLPDYASAKVFPANLDRFALTWTSNYGIRQAIDSGADIVCKTDPDMLISSGLACRIARIKPGTAAAPAYHMAQSAQEAAERPLSCKCWDGSRGTIAMHSDDWEAVSGYDERMIGYGPEDGDLCDRCNREGITVDRLRGSPIFHIAHNPGTPQRKGPRYDQWGRSDGFNAENRPEINALRDLNNWRNPQWGRF